MSISSTGLYGSATIVNSDLFNDVETLKGTIWRTWQNVCPWCRRGASGRCRE